MRKPEPVDEFAETQVLIRTEDRPNGHDADALSLYAEYESELARSEPPNPRETRTRR